VRTLGVDLGRSRTGLALSDPLGVTCRPLDIVAERDEERLITVIAAVVREEEVEEIVVGLPRPLSGGINTQMENTVAFAERLMKAVPVRVVLWDERFTSTLAERGRPRTKAHDGVAACFILQNYLDSRMDSTTGDV